MRKTEFPLLANSNVAYLDNASSTQKPLAVLDAMREFYTHDYANVHRGLYTLSERATAAYEAARVTTQRFLNAKESSEIVFTSGTTASLNLVAAQLSELLIKPGDVILLTPMEHHSNLVPWQMAAKRLGATVEYMDVTNNDELDLATLDSKLHSKVKIVSLAHISNAAGTIHPIEQVIKQAHAKGIPVVIDAAQSVPHQIIDVQKLDCDFLAFSAHKLCGPTGVGVLYGKRKWLEQMEPYMGGGDMINEVTLQRSTWAELPHKLEAGTPNIVGVIGLGAAITYLTNLGVQAIQLETEAVYSYLLEQLASLEFVHVFGPKELSKRSSIASFTVKGVHPHDVAELLNTEDVAVRAGHHCCQPLMQHWQVPATTRASVYFYNTKSDVDRLIVGLKKIYTKFQ